MSLLNTYNHICICHDNTHFPIKTLQGISKDSKIYSETRSLNSLATHINYIKKYLYISRVQININKCTFEAKTDIIKYLTYL